MGTGVSLSLWAPTKHYETPFQGFSSRGQNGIHFVRLLFPEKSGRKEPVDVHVYNNRQDQSIKKQVNKRLLVVPKHQ